MRPLCPSNYFLLMNTNGDGPNQPKGSGSGREIADALAEVLKDQSEKAKKRVATKPQPKKKTAPLTWGALVVFSAASAYIWLGSPSWLDPSPPAPPPTLAEAGLRMEVFQEALLVEEFREREGRLPVDLAEAGDPDSEVAYARMDDGTYRLLLEGLSQSPAGVEYVSTDSLEGFLGNSLQTIHQGG